MFKDNTEFYPTPKELIAKMTNDIDFRYINNVLEPSAGKGDIAKHLQKKYSDIHSYHRRESLDLDVIELDENLRHILKGENFRVVHDDFLTFNTHKRYDLIILNPPFSSGDRHLLKAIKMQERGGKVVCLLNAETLKKPYSNTRKLLKRKLEELDANVEFLENSFTNAERKTKVEVALIKLDIPSGSTQSVILEGLKQEEEFKEFDEDSITTDLVFTDFLRRIVEHYNFEVSAGVHFIKEYHSMKPYFSPDFKEEKYQSSILQLTVNDDKYNTSPNRMINSYIKSVRLKYWDSLFKSEQFSDLFTSSIRQKYFAKISTLADFDFSIYNIYSLQEEISKSLLVSVEDTIINLFDELSHKYHYHEETGKNIHYFNGWKSNSSWKINKKVIIPLNGYSSWSDALDITDYRVVEKLSDIEKALNYLGQGMTSHEELRETLKRAQDLGQSKKIQLKYFMVTFFKKGTCHIQFTDLDLLSKFNLYGSQKKGWLPPSYGDKEYADMTAEEQLVIDDFQGEKDYKKVLENKEYFLPDNPVLNLMGQALPALEQIEKPESTPVEGQVAATGKLEELTEIEDENVASIAEENITTGIEIIDLPTVVQSNQDVAIVNETVDYSETIVASSVKGAVDVEQATDLHTTLITDKSKTEKVRTREVVFDITEVQQVATTRSLPISGGEPILEAKVVSEEPLLLNKSQEEVAVSEEGSTFPDSLIKSDKKGLGAGDDLQLNFIL
ncbi:DUF4942 domain-containing protein [Priestia filamentosa]|uniref:class I SAM-dependent methyltransferase n=1 Tax=Priestia filamentosa TaxID=1402861 RepID=UPI00398252D7